MNVHTNMNFIHLQMNKFLLSYNSLGFRNQNDHKTQQSIKFYFFLQFFLFCFVFLSPIFLLFPPSYAYVRANDSLSFQRIQMTFTHIHIHGICCQTKHLKLKQIYATRPYWKFFYAF